MSIRVLAFMLLAGASLALAAPPKSSRPKDAPPSDSGQSAETIDVDAMARAKDAEAAAAAEAPPETPPTEAAPSDAAPPETPPADETAVPATTTAETPEAPEAPVGASEPVPAVDAAGVPATAETTEPAATAPSAADVEAKSIAAACVSRATALLDAAEKADYGNATRDFDAKMRTAMPPVKFKEQWEVLSQFGKLQARGQSHLGKGDGYTIVQVPLIFEKTNLVAQIACGSDGRIAGFHVNQAPTPKF